MTTTHLIARSLPMERLDVYLRTQLPDVSRGTLQRLMEEGRLRVDGRTVKPTHHPHAGETVTIDWPQARPPEARPEEMPLSILCEDEDLLVLDKPAGLVVHPAAGHAEHTLVNALLHHCAGQLSGIGGVARPGIIHRLDKDTSGCLLVAKNDPAHIALAAQFSGRSVKKIYQAIVCGELPDESGEIDAPIGRHPHLRKQMAVVSGGRPARTRYKVARRLKGATLVEVELLTGRTHQIRVHFHHIGFPVMGDTVYGKTQNRRLKELARYAAGRQMLHAWRLSFAHPRSGERMTCEAALPPDFLAAMAALAK